MSAPAFGPPARSASAPAWPATFRAVGSLIIFVVSFLIFLFAPLLALLVALGGYLAFRGRSGRSVGTATPTAPPTTASGFGSGAA